MSAGAGCASCDGVPLVPGGGATPPDALLATASGTAFAAIVLGQLANAYACRSESRPVYLVDPRSNRLLLAAVASELALLAVFLGLPPVAQLLGGAWPTPAGWALAALAIPVVAGADTLAKLVKRRSARPGGPQAAAW